MKAELQDHHQHRETLTAAPDREQQDKLDLAARTELTDQLRSRQTGEFLKLQEWFRRERIPRLISGSLYSFGRRGPRAYIYTRHDLVVEYIS